MQKPVSVEIKRSTSEDKKFMAIFTLDNNKTKTIHFGAKGYEDYTMHHDEERKQLYLDRHLPHENWDDPMTAGALSRYILWNKESLADSIHDYKRRFKLQ